MSLKFKNLKIEFTKFKYQILVLAINTKKNLIKIMSYESTLVQDFKAEIIGPGFLKPDALCLYYARKIQVP